MIEFKHVNPREIDSLAKDLEGFESDGAIQHGLFKAGEVFKREGRTRLAERMKSGKTGLTGNLLNSMHVRLKDNKRGVLTGFKTGKGGGSHANLIDRGTNERFYTTKKGKRKSVGRVKGNLFWSDTKSRDYPLALKHLYLGIENATKRITSGR